MFVLEFQPWVIDVEGLAEAPEINYISIDTGAKFEVKFFFKMIGDKRNNAMIKSSLYF